MNESQEKATEGPLHPLVRLSESDWDDVADLCEQGAAACEIGYEEHTAKARTRAAQWMRKLAIKAQRFAVAAGSIAANAAGMTCDRCVNLMPSGGCRTYPLPGRPCNEFKTANASVRGGAAAPYPARGCSARR